MNLAIFTKTLRDSATLLIMASIGTAGFVLLFVWAMQNLGTELFEFLSRFDFLKRIFEVSLGVKMSGEISPSILYAVSFTHLIVLFAGWGSVIAIITRVTIREEEQGTADLLLSLPVRRRTVYFSTTSIWLFSALLLAMSPLAGVTIGTAIFPVAEEIRLSKFVAISFNLFALHVAVGGMTSVISCLSNRRGKAIAIVVSIAFLSATLNFLEPFIPLVERFNFIGLLHYYRPVDIVRNTAWPVLEMAVLAGFGSLTWLAGLMIYCRKDIPVA